MSTPKREVELSQAQIAQVVDVFYDRVQQDAHLAAPFSIVKDWDKHKAIISHFWWMTLGGERYMSYSYDVASKHREVGFTPALLEGDWLPLFEQSMREILPSELADIWMAQAKRIGSSLKFHYEYAQQRNEQNSDADFVELKR